MQRAFPEIGFNLPVITLSGSAFQRGFQHGAGFSSQIANALRRMRESYPYVSYEHARIVAIKSWKALQAVAPMIAEEICGIAAGSNADLIDLYCHIGFEFFEADAPTGCSAVAIAGKDGAIIGQNWDCHPDMIEDLALFQHIGEDGEGVTVVATVGSLGWVGLNRSGLALLSTDVMLDTAKHGFPSQVARRMMLRQTSVSAARACLETLPALAGRTYLLGDRSGSVAVIEVSPSTGICQLAETTRHFHTNHALASQTICVEDVARLQAVYPSSRLRLSTLERAGANAVSVTDLKHVLANRENAPDAVSKTVSSCEPTMTAFSIIFDCGRHDLHLCSGTPSAEGYQRLHWPQTRSSIAQALTLPPVPQAIGVDI